MVGPQGLGGDVVGWLDGWTRAVFGGFRAVVTLRGSSFSAVMPEFAASAAARPVGALERAWSTDSRVLHRARALELSTFTFSVVGRAGVLGDGTDPVVLAAALGSVAPDALRTGWEAARRVGPTAVARAWLDECQAWGGRALPDAADDHLSELLGRVVEAANDTGMPVAAATRALVEARIGAATAGARVALLVHTLAEFRAAAMVMGCRVAGLTPVEALAAEPEGDQEATLLGWSPPFPSRLGVLRRHASAVAIADRLTHDAFRPLTGGERGELVDRLRTLAATVGT
jgi:hypothetical protein